MFSKKFIFAAVVVILFIGGIFLVSEYKKEEPESKSVLSETDESIERFFGKEDSKVIVTEFSDFECPACVYFSPTAKKIRELYKDKIKFVFKQYPLEQHQYAFMAAEASECAGDQDKFWEYEEILFENSKNLTADDLKKYASSLNLDIEKFNFCLDNHSFADKVEANIKEGADRDVSGTPTTFVNDKKVKGAVSFEEIQKIIEEELLKVGS